MGKKTHHHEGLARGATTQQLEDVYKISLDTCHALRSTGLDVIMLGAFPRSFRKCCDSPDHFSPSFTARGFLEDLRDFNTFQAKRINVGLPEPEAEGRGSSHEGRSRPACP